jgi:hypothetical protein
MRYVCESVELIAEAQKNPYLKCTFAVKANNLFATSSSKKVVIAMSGGFFTNNKPDTAKNLEWAQKMKPQFENQETDIDPFVVSVEPYYIKTVDGTDIERTSDGQPKPYDTITVRTFSMLDPATNAVVPCAGIHAVERQGARLLAGSTQYITVAKYNAWTAAKQAAAQVAAPTAPTAAPNAFAGSATNSDPLPM